jgi:hypothetical protein
VAAQSFGWRASGHMDFQASSLPRELVRDIDSKEHDQKSGAKIHH